MIYYSLIYQKNISQWVRFSALAVVLWAWELLMKSYFQTRIWLLNETVFTEYTTRKKNERFDDVIQFIRSKMHFGNFNMRRKYEWTTLKPYLPCVPEQTMPRLLTTVERTSWRETGGGKRIRQFCSAIFSLAHSRTLKLRRTCLLDLLMWRYFFSFFSVFFWIKFLPLFLFCIPGRMTCKRYAFTVY